MKESVPPDVIRLWNLARCFLSNGTRCSTGLQIRPCRLAVVFTACTFQIQTEPWVFAPHKRPKTVGFPWKLQSLAPSCPKLSFKKSLIWECWWTAWKQLMCIWFILRRSPPSCPHHLLHNWLFCVFSAHVAVGFYSGVHLPETEEIYLSKIEISLLIITAFDTLNKITVGLLSMDGEIYRYG